MNKQCVLKRSVIALIFTIDVNSETICDWFYSTMLVANQCRIVFIA